MDFGGIAANSGHDPDPDPVLSGLLVRIRSAERPEPARRGAVQSPPPFMVGP
jgi:hypothetical protein